jgi:hypothetical protein
MIGSLSLKPRRPQQSKLSTSPIRAPSSSKKLCVRGTGHAGPSVPSSEEQNLRAQVSERLRQRTTSNEGRQHFLRLFQLASQGGAKYVQGGPTLFTLADVESLQLRPRQFWWLLHQVGLPCSQCKARHAAIIQIEDDLSFLVASSLILFDEFASNPGTANASITFKRLVEALLPFVDVSLAYAVVHLSP